VCCTYLGGSQDDTCYGDVQTRTSDSSEAMVLGGGLGIGIPSFLVNLTGVSVLFYSGSGVMDREWSPHYG
jgi:hypothetical protein